MPSIKLKLNDPIGLKAFFSKFEEFGVSTIGIINKESIELRGFYDDKSVFKSSTLQLKDVFEEAEINIDQPIFISLYKRIPTLLSYLSHFKNECNLTLNFQKLTTKGMLRLTADWHETEVESIFALDGIKFSDSNLNLNMKSASLDMSQESFAVTKERVDELTNSPSSKEMSSFVLTKDLKSKIMSLVKGANKSTNVTGEIEVISNENTEGNIQFSMKDYFDLKIPELKNEGDLKFIINQRFLSPLDDEDLNVKVYFKDVSYLLAIESTESETFCLAASKLSAK